MSLQAKQGCLHAVKEREESEDVHGTLPHCHGEVGDRSSHRSTDRVRAGRERKSIGGQKNRQ